VARDPGCRGPAAAVLAAALARLLGAHRREALGQRDLQALRLPHWRLGTGGRM
jgi:hypothetical protein